MKLIDGRSMFDMSLVDYFNSPMWTSLARRRGIVLPSNIYDASVNNKTKLHISNGRLVADCNNCNGAQYVWREGPYIMICAECGNKDIGGMAREIEIPTNLQEIEEILLQRPNPENQNWYPGESEEKLQWENIEHDMD